MNEFDKWLGDTSKSREKLRIYSQTGKPAEEAAQALDVLTALEATDKAARLRDAAEAHVIEQRAKIMFYVREKHPDLNSRERELVEKSLMLPYQTVLNDCETTFQGCKSRYFTHK